jgi:cell division protein FtsZ
MEEPAFAENMRRFDPQTAQAQAYGQQPQQTAAANGTYGAYGAQAYTQTAPDMGQSAPSGRQQSIARGIVRDATEEDMANWDEPVRVVRHKRAVGEDNQPQDYGMDYDNDDLEIPTFLRRKAD